MTEALAILSKEKQDMPFIWPPLTKIKDSFYRLCQKDTVLIAKFPCSALIFPCPTSSDIRSPLVRIHRRGKVNQWILDTSKFGVKGIMEFR